MDLCDKLPLDYDTEIFMGCYCGIERLIRTDRDLDRDVLLCSKSALEQFPARLEEARDIRGQVHLAHICCRTSSCLSDALPGRPLRWTLVQRVSRLLDSVTWLNSSDKNCSISRSICLLFVF